MPTYEYICHNEDCAHEFEIFQSMKDDSLIVCPVCGQSTLKRKIGLGAGIIFKGSGFYETDYKRKSSGSSDTSKTKASDSKSSNSTSSSPSKSDN